MIFNKIVIEIPISWRETINLSDSCKGKEYKEGRISREVFFAMSVFHSKSSPLFVSFNYHIAIYLLFLREILQSTTVKSVYNFFQIKLL